jgi:hypothetical protein
VLSLDQDGGSCLLNTWSLTRPCLLCMRTRLKPEMSMSSSICRRRFGGIGTGPNDCLNDASPKAGCSDHGFGAGGVGSGSTSYTSTMRRKCKPHEVLSKIIG